VRLSYKIAESYLLVVLKVRIYKVFTLSRHRICQGDHSKHLWELILVSEPQSLFCAVCSAHAVSQLENAENIASYSMHICPTNRMMHQSPINLRILKIDRTSSKTFSSDIEPFLAFAIRYFIADRECLEVLHSLSKPQWSNLQNNCIRNHHMQWEKFDLKRVSLLYPKRTLHNSVVIS